MERFFKEFADEDAMAAVDQGLWWISPDSVVKGADVDEGGVQQDPLAEDQGDVQRRHEPAEVAELQFLVYQRDVQIQPSLVKTSRSSLKHKH